MNISKTLPKVMSLYEELFKQLLRVFPLKDFDIIVGHYLIEKAKLNEMAQEEEDMGASFRVNYLEDKSIIIERKLKKT